MEANKKVLSAKEAQASQIDLWIRKKQAELEAITLHVPTDDSCEYWKHRCKLVEGISQQTLKSAVLLLNMYNQQLQVNREHLNNASDESDKVTSPSAKDAVLKESPRGSPPQPSQQQNFRNVLTRNATRHATEERNERERDDDKESPTKLVHSSNEEGAQAALAKENSTGLCGVAKVQRRHQVLTRTPTNQSSEQIQSPDFDSNPSERAHMTRDGYQNRAPLTHSPTLAAIRDASFSDTDSSSEDESPRSPHGSVGRTIPTKRTKSRGEKRGDVPSLSQSTSHLNPNASSTPPVSPTSSNPRANLMKSMPNATGQLSAKQLQHVLKQPVPPIPTDNLKDRNSGPNSMPPSPTGQLDGSSVERGGTMGALKFKNPRNFAARDTDGNPDEFNDRPPFPFSPPVPPKLAKPTAMEAVRPVSSKEALRALKQDLRPLSSGKKAGILEKNFWEGPPQNDLDRASKKGERRKSLDGVVERKSRRELPDGSGSDQRRQAIDELETRPKRTNDGATGQGGSLASRMERRMERMSRMRVVGLEGRVASYGLDGQESSDRAAFVRRTDSSGASRGSRMGFTTDDIVVRTSSSLLGKEESIGTSSNLNRLSGQAMRNRRNAAETSPRVKPFTDSSNSSSTASPPTATGRANPLAVLTSSADKKEREKAFVTGGANLQSGVSVSDRRKQFLISGRGEGNNALTNKFDPAVKGKESDKDELKSSEDKIKVTASFKRASTMRISLFEVDEKIAALPPCVKSDHEEVVYSIEVPTPLTHATAQVSAIFIPDYYSIQFQNVKHFNYIAIDEDGPKFPYIVSIKARPRDHAFQGLMNSRKGFKLFSIPDNFFGKTLIESIDHGHVQKYFQKTHPKTNLLKLKDLSCISDIASIETLHRQDQKSFAVSVIYCKEGQTNPLEMFKNVEHSPMFDKFLKAIECNVNDSITTNTNDNNASPTNTNISIEWQGKTVKYLLATKLNSEAHRRLIGNTQAVIFFQDSTRTPFVIREIDMMGIVPQFYFVVQAYKEGRYRLGFFHRVNLRQSEPFIPSNVIFDTINIKDFILTKILNSYLVARTVPPINRLYESPRQLCINNFVAKYAKESWIKKHASDLEL